MNFIVPIIGRLSIDRSWFAIAVIWVFQLAATIGIYLGEHDWFLSKTPFTLLIYTLLCLWVFPFEEATFRRKAILLIILGFAFEWIGINHIPIFGEYEYGENFGFQIAGTPLLIGFNWMVLALTTHALASKISTKKFVVVTLAAALMVFLDLFMEEVADPFDFWHFENSEPPIVNYISWFVIGLIMQLVLWGSELSAHFRFSIHHYSANLLFFGFFAIYFLLS